MLVPIRRIYFPFAAIAALIFAFGTFAYSPHYTHPDLTIEMAQFYNSVSAQKIDDKFLPLMRQGSIDEDIDPRWINHFYDPQSGEGWSGEHLGPHEKELVQSASQKIIAIGFTPLAAWQWAMDQNAQNLFMNYGWNHTWQKAIYDYVNGNKEKAFESLGYILHLIEDMSVPDHTRNDSHPHVLGDPGSPYEDWAKNYTNSHKLDTAESLIKNKEPLPSFSNLKEAFDYVARYSNENFFSEETINDSKYSLPKAIRFETKGVFTYAYGIPSDEETVLYKFSNQDINTATLRDEEILSAYFFRLSRRSVLAGAGVIDLFFREVEMAKQNPSLLEEPPPPPNSLGTIGTLFYTRMVSPLGEVTGIVKPIKDTVSRITDWFSNQKDKFKETVFNTASVLYGSSVSLSDLELENDAVTVAQPTAQAVNLPLGVLTEAKPLQTPTQEIADNNQVSGTTENLSLPPLQPDPAIVNSPTGVGGFSGGLPPGAGAAPSILNSGSQQSSETATPPPPKGDVTAPSMPEIKIPEHDGEQFSSTTITFGGFSENRSTISTNFSSTTSITDENSRWSFTLGSFLPGTTTIEFFATDEAGNKSKASMRSVVVDSTGPEVTLRVSNCNQSLAAESCLIPDTTVTLEWSSSAIDLKHYTVSCTLSGVSCAHFPDLTVTTSTSTIYTVPNDDALYVFRASAVDTLDNQGVEQSKSVEVVTRPVVINEIAWAGTSAARDKDEWIELFNRTSKVIDISQMKVKSATDSKPNIDLAGIIAAGGYYLIERTDDNTISNVSADLTVSFGNGSGAGISNSGEVLELIYKGTAIDSTPSCGSNWSSCSSGGADHRYRSLERIDADALGSDILNWFVHNQVIKNGTNADNADILGTPRERNSANYMVAPSGAVTNNKTLKKSKSPYLINEGITINPGVALTIEPGVVVKFASNTDFPSLKVQGKLSAVGTANDPIVFTSFHDDMHGGDTNGNSGTTSPAVGDWKTLLVDGSVATSIFDHVILRYGGASVGGSGSIGSNAMVSIVSSGVDVKNAIIEYSATDGLYLNGGSGNVLNSTIQSNTGLDRYGMKVAGGSVTIQGSSFVGNTNGLSVVDGPHTVLNNTFTNNTNRAVYFGSGQTAGTPTFSGNTASGNGTNGIEVTTIVSDYTFEKDLPYVGNILMPGGKIFTIKPGVVFKNSGGSVNGKLVAEGSALEPIVFTSLKDDDYGGDTNNDGSVTTPSAGDWGSLTFEATSASSTLKHIIFRYGAACGVCGVAPAGAVKVDGTSVEIANATFENSKSYGLWLVDSPFTTITSSIFKDHIAVSGVMQSIALVLASSTPRLDGVIFSGNDLGIAADGLSSVTVESGGVTFNSNTANTSPADLIP